MPKRKTMRFALLTAVVGFLATACQPSTRVHMHAADYQGRPQYVITTPHATYWLDVAAGGFSRLIDRGGKDWIAFSKDPLQQFPASAAAGYRGIPNAVFGAGNPDAGAGHPGFDQCVSEIIPPDTIHTVTRSGRFAWTWTFADDSTRMKVLTADSEHPWWFLYEGPVGGRWSPETHYWGTDKGGPRRDRPGIGSQFFDDIRWAYFGDDASPRVLFLAQVEPDQLHDTVWYLGSENGGAIESSDGMAVFGFGRGPGTKPQFRGAGQEFVVGFFERQITDADAHSAIANHIEALVRQEP